MYRLPGYPDSMESDFTKWCLWSRNQRDQPQGVISHGSALASHGFGIYNPAEIHLTVPARFRKAIPDEVIIHKASLPISAVESHSSFMVTRLGQTLLDMRKELEAKGEWESILEKVVAEGRLSHEEMINLGLIFSPNTISGDNVNPDISCGHIVMDAFMRKVEQLEAQSSKESAFDPVSEGVWKMIYDRAETGRRRSRAGFTLVELLMVIAVMSILSALLLPTLSQAVKTARALVCVNNLKQYGMVYLIYLDNNQNWYPNGRWGTQTVAYIDDRKIGKCPMVKEKTDGGGTILLSYAYPGVYFAGGTYIGFANFSDLNYGVRQSQVKLPSEKCLLTEYWDNTKTTTRTWNDFSSLNNQCVMSLHAGKVNLLFSDNHVSSLKVWGGSIVTSWDDPETRQWASGGAAPGATRYPIWCPKNTTSWQ